MDLKLILPFLLSLPLAVLAAEPPIQVAVLDGEGVGPSYEQLIASYPATKKAEFRISRITTEQIQAGKLTEVDVLVHPGGSGG